MNTDNNNMGRLLHGFPTPPASFGTQTTSAIFHARAKVLDRKELFIMDVIICKVAGRLSLSILTGTLSNPGALLEGKCRIIFATSFSDAGLNSNCSLRVRRWVRRQSDPESSFDP